MLVAQSGADARTGRWRHAPAAALRTSSNGLTAREAEARLIQYGPHALPQSAAVSQWSVLLAQFKNVVVTRKTHGMKRQCSDCHESSPTLPP